MLTRAFKTTACILVLAMALPAAAIAALTEVGLIEKTTPPTTPSCTAGPLGAFGQQMEKEKKEEEAASKKKRAGGKKKKKKHAGHKASRWRGRRASSARRRRGRPVGHAAAVTTATEAEATGNTTTTTTNGEEEQAGSETEEGAEAPCLAVSRTTGFQAKVGPVGHPLIVPREGRIVAWTIQLGRPTAAQIKFFNENEGGAASAGIALLSPVKTKGSTPLYHLLAQSPVVSLESYFGLTVEFPLSQSIKVKKGDMIALTVPTWAPALALGFGKNTSWRASRQQGQCSVTNTQTAQTELKSNVQYFCRYRTARLTYSATLISTP